MRGAFLLATALVLGCRGSTTGAAADAGQVEASAPAVDAGAPGRLLWFGPHPDDEFYASPLIGHYCRDLGWRCALVVLTRGEGGSCALPAGCLPDLETVRLEEMRASAALLGADLDSRDLGDNGRFEPYAGDVQEVLQLWASREGDLDALVARVASAISERAPTLVLTVDPRHGNYCHPTHRATGALVVSAIQKLGAAAPPLQMVASRGATSEEGLGFVPVVPSDPTLTSFDATVYSTTLGGEAWGFFPRVLRAHRSQFAVSDGELELLATAPAQNKRVFLVSLSDVTRDDPRYRDLCPPSTFLR